MRGMGMRGVPVAAVVVTAVAVLAVTVLVLRLHRSGDGERSEGRKGNQGEAKKRERWGFHFWLGFGNFGNCFVEFEVAIFDEGAGVLIQPRGRFSFLTANEYSQMDCVADAECLQQCGAAPRSAGAALHSYE
jgi:hypothetical protein